MLSLLLATALSYQVVAPGPEPDPRAGFHYEVVRAASYPGAAEGPIRIPFPGVGDLQVKAQRDEAGFVLVELTTPFKARAADVVVIRNVRPGIPERYYRSKMRLGPGQGIAVTGPGGTRVVVTPEAASP